MLHSLYPNFCWQFECGNATEESRWWTLHSFRKMHVALAWNLGPPSPLMDVMAGVMPGQNMIDLARAVIEVTPWCAECSAVKVRVVWLCGLCTGWLHLQCGDGRGIDSIPGVLWGVRGKTVGSHSQWTTIFFCFCTKLHTCNYINRERIIFFFVFIKAWSWNNPRIF